MLNEQLEIQYQHTELPGRCLDATVMRLYRGHFQWRGRKEY